MNAEELITQVTPTTIGFTPLKLSLDQRRIPSEDYDVNSPRGTTADTTMADVTTTAQQQQERLTAPWRPNELLPPQFGGKKGKKCLVLDLDETLVHSSFVPTEHYDITLTVDIEGTERSIYVAKRPHVDEFLLRCGEMYEIVVFTASLAKYADPLLDLLDVHKVIDHRLFRESCTCFSGIFVKDLFRMGRPLTQTIIIDNSPHSYIFNPENALPCISWFDDRSDGELLDLLAVLKRLSEPKVDNVMKELQRVTTNEVMVVENTTTTTQQDSVSESDDNDEVTGSVDVSENDELEIEEDDGQNSQWKADN